MDELLKEKLRADAEMEEEMSLANDEQRIKAAVNIAYETVWKSMQDSFGQDLLRWDEVKLFLWDIAIATDCTDPTRLIEALQEQLIIGGWQ